MFGLFAALTLESMCNSVFMFAPQLINNRSYSVSPSRLAQTKRLHLQMSMNHLYCQLATDLEIRHAGIVAGAESL